MERYEESDKLFITTAKHYKFDDFVGSFIFDSKGNKFTITDSKIGRIYIRKLTDVLDFVWPFNMRRRLYFDYSRSSTLAFNDVKVILLQHVEEHKLYAGADPAVAIAEKRHFIEESQSAKNYEELFRALHLAMNKTVIRHFF